MRVIVAGSRSITNYKVVERAIRQSGFNITTLVHGDCRGPDRLGELWARENSVKFERFPANWSEYGKQAGYLRNLDMANNADALIAVYDGKSRGTQHMINIAKEKGLKVFVYTVTKKG